MNTPAPVGQPQTSPAQGADLQAVLRSLVKFTVVQGIVTAILAYLLSQFLWTDPASQHAVTVSAWVAFFVQILTFGICRLVATQNLIAGWGIGTLLRFATVGVWAFLGIKALGLAPSPALLSLVTFFFVSTVIEPLFLNS